MSIETRATLRMLAAGLLAISELMPLAQANPVAPAAVESLISTADAIVVAKVLEGTAFGDTASVTLAVESSMKGQLSPGASVSIVWSELPMHYYVSSPIGKHRGLFFLRQDATGKWSIISAMNGRIDFERTFFYLPEGVKPAEFRAAPGDTIEDKVFLELAWMTSAAEPGQIGAWADLSELFRNLRSPVTRRVFRQFAASSSAKLVMLGLKSILLDGDIGVLTRIERDTSLLEMPGMGGVIDHIEYYYSNPDPAGIKILGRLTTASGTRSDLKLAAIGALARIHTSAALPYLAPLLESTDLTLKTYAVGGLSMFANNIPTGTHHPAPGDWRYRTEETMAHSTMSEGIIAQNEAYYVGFWRDWWRDHQAELGTP